MLDERQKQKNITCIFFFCCFLIRFYCKNKKYIIEKNNETQTIEKMFSRLFCLYNFFKYFFFIFIRFTSSVPLPLEAVSPWQHKSPKCKVPQSTWSKFHTLTKPTPTASIPLGYSRRQPSPKIQAWRRCTWGRSTNCKERR